MPAGTVEVLLIGAVGIKDTEVFGKADPYAVVFCGNQKQRSNTASNQGSKPIWNQKFSFYIDERTTDLQIKIYNHNILKEDDELGSTTIPLARAFADGKLPTTSYNVVRPSGRVQGEIKLSIAFTPKQRPGQHNVEEIPGPYSAKMHGSPYAAVPPEPAVKHDPLTGPDGYFKNSSTSPSSHGRKPHSFSFSSNTNVGGNGSYPPSSDSAYPPSFYPPVSPVNLPYPRTESGRRPSYQHADSFSSSDDDGSAHGRLYPVTPSTSSEYAGNTYVHSPAAGPYPSRPPHLSAASQFGSASMSSLPSAYPPHLSPASHLGSASISSPPSAYPPPGGHNPVYPSGASGKLPQGGSNQFQFDNLAGNFGSLRISGNDSSSHGGQPGYHSTTSSYPSKPPDGYPPIESGSGYSVSGNFSNDRPAGGYPPSVSGHLSNDRPASGYPSPGYPTTGYPSQYDSSSHGEFPRPGAYSLYGYQTPPPSFYPEQMGLPQQPNGRTGDAPAPYYDASPTQYVPAGYPR